MSEPVIAQIESQVREQVQAWLGSGVQVAGRPSMQVRAWSYLIRFPLAAAGHGLRGILVKVPRTDGTKSLEEATTSPYLRTEAREEFNTLRAVSTAFGRAHAPYCQSIRPLAYLDDWNAIVMEEVEAESLKDALYRPLMLLNREQEWGPFEVALERAGQWLRIFHEEVGDARREVLDTESLHNEAARVLRQLSYIVDSRTPIETVSNAFNCRLAYLKEWLVPVANLHGDFNCANILLTPCGRVLGSDPNTGTRGPVYEELARLITDLSTRKRQVITFGYYIRRRRLVRCQHAILKGYFGEQQPDMDVLNLFCALAVLRKWLQNEREVVAIPAAVRYPAGFFRPFMRRYFMRLAMNYLSES